MSLKIHRAGGFEYVDEGEGPVLLLLHGLFGALSNWLDVINEFSDRYRLIIPLMPIYKKSKAHASVDGLAAFVKEFIEMRGIQKCTLLGNSLGGHVAMVLALEMPEHVNAMVLTGSSGLFESGMGSTFPKRGNETYVKERVQFTFFDPSTATKVLIDEVFDIINDNYKALRILKIARAAQRHNMSEEIPSMNMPVLLAWGLNDNITPANVAHEFHRLLPNSELRFIDECGHAAMMEKPAEFNRILDQFLQRNAKVIAAA